MLSFVGESVSKDMATRHQNISPKKQNTPVTRSRSGSKSNPINNADSIKMTTSTNRFDILANPNDDRDCKMCKIVFVDAEDKVLKCKRCKEHYCITCLDKPVAVYNMIMEDDSMWFCAPCRAKVEDHIVTDLQIEQTCRKMMAEYEDRLATVEAAIADKCSKKEAKELIQKEVEKKVADKCSKNEAKELVQKEVEKKVAEKCSKNEAKEMIKKEVEKEVADKLSKLETKEIILQELDKRLPNKDIEAVVSDKENAASPNQASNVNDVLSEIKERKQRENNFIIYGIEETKVPKKYEERQEYDLNKAIEVVQACKVEIEADEIERTARIGKFNKEKMKRPILIVLKDGEKKRQIFKGAKDMRETFQDVALANDFTPAERESEFKLYQEAKELEKNCQGGFKYKVRGPPWARKVVKFKEVARPEDPPATEESA